VPIGISPDSHCVLERLLQRDPPGGGEPLTLAWL